MFSAPCFESLLLSPSDACFLQLTDDEPRIYVCLGILGGRGGGLWVSGPVKGKELDDKMKKNRVQTSYDPSPPRPSEAEWLGPGNMSSHHRDLARS